ncbi:MAG: 1-phosphofructokinase family hexose kinase [Pyrinomonadaceae bacterium]
MGRILIICLNSAIDQIVEIQNWHEGSVMRSSKCSMWMSGKGFNSARALSKLKDIEVDVIAVVGSESRKFFEAEIGNNSTTFLFSTPGYSRTNITLTLPDGSLIAHIQTQGFILSSRGVIEEVLEKVRLIGSNTDIVILSGSLPQGLNKDTYEFLIRELKIQKKRVLFDSSGEELLSGLQAGPFFIKPNLEEFEFLLGRKVHAEDLQSVASDLRSLKRLDAQYIALTLGKDGLLFYDVRADKIYYGNLILESEYKSVNEIGCGDSFMAGFAYGLARNKSVLKAVESGIRFGAANLFADGPGEINLSSITDETRFEWRSLA